MAIRKERHSTSWSVSDAKAHLDDVLDEVENERPQTLIRNGDERAAIVPIDGWRTENPPAGTLLDFFQSSGLGDYELDITRPRDSGRDVDF